MRQILSLGQKEAQLAIRVIQMALERQNKAAVIAVADAHGELIALLRLDGAPYPSILIATNKAWTAARERKATRELGQAARHPENGFDMAYFGDSRYIGWGGGMPVVVAGKVVGAVAVSGLPEAEDMVLAEMGVAAIVAGMSLAAASHSPHLTCQVVRPGEAFIGKQALSYAPGISAESVGAQGIHLQLVTIPPRGRAKAHLHEQHETAIYILSGESHMWYGANLTEHLTAGATDFLYIPANMPHLPYNASETEPCIALIARTDPNEQESVVLLPELDKEHVAVLFVTYTNRNNPHVTIHCSGCNQIAKHGGVHKQGQDHYHYHTNYADAERYAQNTNLPLKNCSFCNPLDCTG